MNEIKRCDWAEHSDLERKYHDQYWGIPSRDERYLFKMLILEGMQAGLSWSTILKKQSNFELAFDQFDPEIIARYDEEKVESLMQNSGIVRNRLKINAAIGNAKAYLVLKEEQGGLVPYLWEYVKGVPIVNHWKRVEEVPANTELSDTISKDLKKRGFRFVGSTIVYAYMQSIGMVNDHLINCAFR